MKCPKCSIPLTPTDYEGLRILLCGSCKGHLLTLARMESLKRIAGEKPESLRAAAAEFAGSTGNVLLCPNCSLQMRKHLLKLPVITAHADICGRCEMVWLDAGELALAQLAHQASAHFQNAADLKQRMGELESDPERKAEFEKNLAKLPLERPSDDDTLEQMAGQALFAYIRALMRGKHG